MGVVKSKAALNTASRANTAGVTTGPLTARLSDSSYLTAGACRGGQCYRALLFLFLKNSWLVVMLS
jgi:hypothetical protein